MTPETMFRAYEQVRRSGRYNMITEARQAADAAGLSMDDYKFVINNYTNLKEEYGEYFD